MSGDVVLACPNCGASVLADDRFCEACGEGLDRPDRSTAADRTVDLGTVAGSTHRGRVHPRNEDALFLQRLGERDVAMVVCDGVSSSVAPDLAADRAAKAAGAVLVDALRRQPDALVPATTDALAAAQRAVADLGWQPPSGAVAPACTFVSCVAHGGTLAIGWVGDSRAYWIGEEAFVITLDNSWAQEQVAARLLTTEQAESDPRSHLITRWLGADAPREPDQVMAFSPPSAGRLILCSDGLWNYAPSPDRLASLVQALPCDSRAIDVARSLTAMALEAGGIDNITVAVLSIGDESA